jgi:hypothetical protein
MKLYVETLLNFATHSRQNETQSQKGTPVKTKHSQCGVMWQTDAIGFRKCALGPLSSSFTEAVTTIIVQELSDTTSYNL